MIVGLLFACTPAGTTARPEVIPTTSSPRVDPGSLIGGEIDPVGTTWTGQDSGGDVTVITLLADHRVDIGYEDTAYSDPNDTWAVADGVLTVRVFIDDANGFANYTGTWNPATSTIDATFVTTVSGRQLTVSLSRW
jgi:hypothetical protein